MEQEPEGSTQADICRLVTHIPLGGTLPEEFSPDP